MDSSIFPRSSSLVKMPSAGGQLPRQMVAPACASAFAMANPKPPSSDTPATSARLPVRSMLSMAPSLHPFESRIGPELPADFRAGLAVHAHHVGGEIEPPLKEARADAVHVHWHALFFELPDLLDAESAGDHDLHPVEPFTVEGFAHVADQLRI